MRNKIPDDKVLSFRVSHTDWIDGGWTTEDTVDLASRLKSDGVDLIDVSSGGSTAKTVALMRQMRHDEVGKQDGRKDPVADIPIAPGYQVPGAEAVRAGANIPVAAVGLITEPEQAKALSPRSCRYGNASASFSPRPNWPIHAAIKLGETHRVRIPVQYYLAWKDFGEFRYEPVSAPTLEARE